MDQYRTWLSGLKRALLYQDDQTLHSATKIAATILNAIPEEVRGSTFVGQPGLLKILSNLQIALGSGRNAEELKTALSSQVRLWEGKKSPTAYLGSPPLSPSSYTIESSYESAGAVDLATRRQRVCPASSTLGHSQSILPFFNEANAPSATFLQQRSGSVPGEGFGDAVERTAKAKHNFLDSAENLAAEIKKCNIDPDEPRRRLVDNLLQTSTDQQLLAVKYQELNTLVDLLQERDKEWMGRLAQDTNWRMAVDRKLQTILNVLDRSPLAFPSSCR